MVKYSEIFILYNSISISIWVCTNKRHYQRSLMRERESVCKRERERAGEIEINIKCILLYNRREMSPKRKQCSCKEHDTYSKGKNFVVFKNDGKKNKEESN